MSRKRFRDEDDGEPFAKLLEALERNSENLKKVMGSIAGVCEAVDGKYEENTEKILKNINSLHADVEKLIKALQSKVYVDQGSAPSLSGTEGSDRSVMIMRCQDWEQFESFAVGAKFTGFSYLVSDNIFEADAVKGNQIIAYTGPIPSIEDLLKAWLSNRLAVPKGTVFAGTIEAAER
jgi:hypothetical protein